MSIGAGDFTAEDINDQIEDEKENLNRPTILVCGYTGVGKTSLIQAICGKDVVPEDKIGHAVPETDDYCEYKNDLVRFWDSEGLIPSDNEDDFIQETKEFIKKTQRKDDPEEHIHLVWYCISGVGGRVTETDRKLMNEIFRNEDMLVLLTKSDAMSEKQKKGMKENILETTNIDSNQILTVSNDNKEECKTVMEKSHEMLPDAYQRSFMSAQVISIEDKKSKAHGVIHSASASAAAAGAIPIAGSDAPILVSIQTGMIGSLAILYGITKEAAISAVGPALAKSAGLTSAGSLSKLMPGIGSVIQASVAASITEALGWTVQKYLEAVAKAKVEGKDIPDFDKYADLFKEQLDNDDDVPDVDLEKDILNDND